LPYLPLYSSIFFPCAFDVGMEVFIGFGLYVIFCFGCVGLGCYLVANWVSDRSSSPVMLSADYFLVPMLVFLGYLLDHLVVLCL
jgi:hypothetical protein